MSLPLDWEEGKYPPSINKCEHGVLLTLQDDQRSSVCSICKSMALVSIKPKAVSKAKIRKLEKQLPKIEESVVEEIILEREDTSDDPQELRIGEESEKTDFEFEENTQAQGA